MILRFILVLSGFKGGLCFFFRSEFFFRTTRELEYLFSLSRDLTLGYITKTLNQIIFFSSTKIRIFFQQHWESEYFFRKKTPFQVKWSFPKAEYFCVTNAVTDYLISLSLLNHNIFVGKNHVSGGSFW